MVVPPSPPARRGHWWLLRIEGVAGAAPEFKLPEHERWDDALRADVVGALLADGLRRERPATPVTVVLQRPGGACDRAEDLAWESATRAALAARGTSGDFVVQTRTGRHRPR